MHEYPDLTNSGYKIKTELGRNREGGRITWQGTDLANQQTVVIKQFCFAIAGSNWSGYKAYEQEIKVLKSLDHPHIPKYLDGVETENGFCLIQEYIPADNLADFSSLTLSKIKHIALNLLEILVYLQQQNPPVLHRDLKPDNILLDQDLNAYLIDFGFASLGSQEVSGSSVFKGTPGFIAPEQIIKPTLASDLYSLGITLVSLLTNKDIAQLRDFTAQDDPYQLDLKSLLPPLNRQFVIWLEKMTNAKTSKRFADAATARDALLAVDLNPELSNSIVTSNNLPSTNLLKTQITVGTLAIFSLSTVAVWGINFAQHHTESKLIDIAIALMAAVVITLTELGAVEIAQSDQEAKLPGAILGISVPILLVILSSFIRGIGEAVDIAVAIIMAEIFTLSYYWWQLPGWQARNLPIKVGSWFGAIALGIILSLKLI